MQYFIYIQCDNKFNNIYKLHKNEAGMNQGGNDFWQPLENYDELRGTNYWVFIGYNAATLAKSTQMSLQSC